MEAKLCCSGTHVRIIKAIETAAKEMKGENNREKDNCK